MPLSSRCSVTLYGVGPFLHKHTEGPGTFHSWKINVSRQWGKNRPPDPMPLLARTPAGFSLPSGRWRKSCALRLVVRRASSSPQRWASKSILAARHACWTRGMYIPRVTRPFSPSTTYIPLSRMWGWGLFHRCRNARVCKLCPTAASGRHPNSLFVATVRAFRSSNLADDRAWLAGRQATGTSLEGTC